MSLINRVKVLWYLSGLEFDKTNDMADHILAKKIEREAKFHRETLKKKRPAIIVPDESPEFFPIAEEENDKTSKQTPAD
jgi:hypothetical protein